MEYFMIMVIGLAVLAILSGMLGLGVAFAAVPFLSFFLPDLVNQVQPLTLLLNGLTALLATFGFAKSGLVDWKKAITLAVVTTAAAPIGSYLGTFHQSASCLVFVSGRSCIFDLRVIQTGERWSTRRKI